MMSKPEAMTPADHAEQVRQGQDAQQLQQLLKKHLEALRGQVFETFGRSDAHDAPGHRMLRLHLRVLDDLEGRLKGAIATGELARKKLVTTEKDSKLKKVLNRV